MEGDHCLRCSEDKQANEKTLGDPRGKKKQVRRFWREGMLKSGEAWGKIPEPVSWGSVPQQDTSEVTVKRFQPHWSSVPPRKTLCSRSSTARQLADCRGTGNQGAGKDRCRQMFLTPELLSTRKGKMSKVVFFFFFLDLYTYSFNLNNLAYHEAAGETQSPSPLSAAPLSHGEEAQLRIFRATLHRV